MRRQDIISVVVTICVIGICTCFHGCEQSSEKKETRQAEEYLLVQILGMYQAQISDSSIDYILAVEKFMIQNGFIKHEYNGEMKKKILENNSKILQCQTPYKRLEIRIITAQSSENSVYILMAFFNSDELLGKATPTKLLDDVTKLAQESGVLHYSPYNNRWELLGEGGHQCEIELSHYYGRGWFRNRTV